MAIKKNSIDLLEIILYKKKPTTYSSYRSTNN
jgi:hypothetical protein